MNFDSVENAARSGFRTLSGQNVTFILSKCFDEEWHPYHGARLAVFPRFLVLHDMERGVALSCWPDLATLVEDADVRQIAYYPAECSSRSLRLVFDKVEGDWKIFLYDDELLLQQLAAPTGVSTKVKAGNPL